AKKINKTGRGDMADEAFKAMQHAGFTTAMDNFFHELLSQDPTLPFWDQYVAVAADAGQTERMLALVRSTSAKDDLSDSKKAALRQILVKALLAADNVDEGVAEIRALLAQETPPSESHDEFSAGQLGAVLARIGTLMEKPEWTDEGVAAAKKWL